MSTCLVPHDITQNNATSIYMYTFQNIQQHMMWEGQNPKKLKFPNIHMEMRPNTVSNMINVIMQVIIQVFVCRSPHKSSEVNFTLHSYEARTVCPFSSNIVFSLYMDACRLRIIMAFSVLVWLRLNYTSWLHLLYTYIIG